MPARKKSAGAAAGRGSSRWSAEVMRHSNALDLEPGVFTWKDPQRIAASLKRSAETSTRRKAGPYRSALSMLTFHINRAGSKLPARQKKILERAKIELGRQFDRS
jgi:putative cell wall-binding protein